MGISKVFRAYKKGMRIGIVIGGMSVFILIILFMALTNYLRSASQNVFQNNAVLCNATYDNMSFYYLAYLSSPAPDFSEVYMLPPNAIGFVAIGKLGGYSNGYGSDVVQIVPPVYNGQDIFNLPETCI